MGELADFIQTGGRGTGGERRGSRRIGFLCSEGRRSIEAYGSNPSLATKLFGWSWLSHQLFRFTRNKMWSNMAYSELLQKLYRRKKVRILQACSWESAGKLGLFLKFSSSKFFSNFWSFAFLFWHQKQSPGNSLRRAARSIFFWILQEHCL